MKTITGTNHFINFAAALRYYSAYGMTQKDVDAKISDLEIVIGAPIVKEGEKLEVNKEGRYMISRE